MRSFPVAATALLAGIALGAFAGPARADIEVSFGGFSPAGCAAGTGAGDQGAVCGPTAVISTTVAGSLDVFDIAAFSDHFTTVADLTFKAGAGSTVLPNTNLPDEQGFGENGLGTTACTDSAGATNCELAGNASVAISSTVGLVDAVVASAQAGEGFTVWAGDSLATLAPVGSGVGCDLCTVTFGASKFVGLTSNGTGDVLLAGISVPTPASIPEPASALLFSLSLFALAGALRLRRQGG